MIIAMADVITMQYVWLGVRYTVQHPPELRQGEVWRYAVGRTLSREAERAMYWKVFPDVQRQRMPKVYDSDRRHVAVVSSERTVVSESDSDGSGMDEDDYDQQRQAAAAAAVKKPARKRKQNASSKRTQTPRVEESSKQQATSAPGTPASAHMYTSNDCTKR